MRAPCLTFGRRHSLRERRPRVLKRGPCSGGPLESLGCRSQSDRRSRKSRGVVCGVAAPLRCAEASPSSRLLASDPSALATPLHTLLQHPAQGFEALTALDRLLAQLEEAKRGRPGAGRTAALLRSVGKRDFPDAESLIRFHDTLLFLRAYPHSRTVLRLAEKLLEGFARRVEQLEESGGDLAPFDHPEVSGIAGTTIT